MKLFGLCILCFIHSCALPAQPVNAGCKVELYMLKTNHIPQTDMDEPIGYFMPSKSDLADNPLVADNEMLGSFRNQFRREQNRVLNLANKLASSDLPKTVLSG